jgi:hypothetical protein
MIFDETERLSMKSSGFLKNRMVFNETERGFFTVFTPFYTLTNFIGRVVSSF